ncbi:alpha-amylase family protein [Clostridium sp. D5]|uniref:alpha-amylase family protein n=1 Tax=Clostridium sp. D5 TaxID=556261 RepID=UPI0001FC7AC5|nr:alpha-amylase family protein [Clostridium sp. D5]EGB91663.1 hypothetical protein HMPREF0240_03315 [Clostridium sp. D5]
MEEIRYRQVHMDFHTSQYITETGKDFDAERFAERLEQAHVDSVTCFARCHHGWLYYPSRNHPELMHPNLERKNLLLEQIEACHRRGIRVPVYTTVRWDERIIREKPEWLCRDEYGNPVDKGNVPEPHFYYDVCLNSGYREFFKEHLRDIIHVVGKENLDGIFMDIVSQTECCCEDCRRLMLEEGMNPELRSDRVHFAALTLNCFRSEISALIREYAPDATIFYNDPGVDLVMKRSVETYSHLELESLPSGDWGYDHFPVMARYVGHFGKDMIGMTGKFHTSWGDFHSLKNKAALEFECFQMLAMGAGCSVGDQLHPWGKLSDATYDLIGSVYESVEQKEPYCRGTRPEAEIAVLTPHVFLNPILDGRELPKSLIGAVHMLQEMSYQFTMIDSEECFEAYPLLVLPDELPYSEELEKKLKMYVENGGAVFGSFHACVNGDESELYGIRGIGKSKYSREFILPNQEIGKELPKEPFVMYERGMDAEAVLADVIMEKTRPWFERGSSGMWPEREGHGSKECGTVHKGQRFCSHQHAPTPDSERKGEMFQKGNVIYCAHPVFEIYRKNAPIWCKKMVGDAIQRLCPNKLVSHNGPSGLLCILNQKIPGKQGAVKDVLGMPAVNEAGERIKLLHLLHYIPEKRSEEIYTIEDVIPLYHTEFSVYVGGHHVLGMQLVPEGRPISWEQSDGYVRFEIQKIEGHQMVEIRLV